jgi:hypothetical protein
VYSVFGPELEAVDRAAPERQYEPRWTDLARVLGMPVPWWPAALLKPEEMTRWKPGDRVVMSEAITDPDIGPLLRLAASEPDDSSTRTVLQYMVQTIQAAAIQDAQGDIDLLEEACDPEDRDARGDVRGDELDELGGICTFNQTRQLYYAADALAWLPSQAEMAEDYAEQAVDAYRDTGAPDWAFGDQAGSHADLAIARIGQRQLEGAADALAPVLELPAEQRINGIVNSVQRVHTALRRSPLSQDPQAYDLQDSIEAFTRTPASALPR